MGARQFHCSMVWLGSKSTWWLSPTTMHGLHSIYISWRKFAIFDIFQSFVHSKKLIESLYNIWENHLHYRWLTPIIGMIGIATVNLLTTSVKPLVWKSHKLKKIIHILDYNWPILLCVHFLHLMNLYPKIEINVI